MVTSFWKQKKVLSVMGVDKPVLIPRKEINAEEENAKCTRRVTKMGRGFYLAQARKRRFEQDARNAGSGGKGHS